RLSATEVRILPCAHKLKKKGLVLSFLVSCLGGFEGYPSARMRRVSETNESEEPWIPKEERK
ncbi:hypothetical protein C4565_10885, partial [Candidatus Parcubacteria bacterium]